MKKRIYTILAIMALMSAVAYSQLSFGIRAGVNFQNINGKDSEGDKLENDLLVGFNAGVDAEIPVAPDFYFQPGLLYSTKGSKDKDGTLNLGYLELPLHVVYKPQLGTGRLIVGFGPYVAYGIMGKLKIDGEPETDVKFKQGDVTAEEALDAFYLKGLDAGADIFFGYEFAFKVTVQLNAQLGLLNMWPSYAGDDNDKSVFKNTGFGLSLGYRF